MPASQQLLDVLPALGVRATPVARWCGPARRRRISCGLRRQRRVEVELQQLSRRGSRPSRRASTSRPEHQRLRFRPAVRLDVADDDVDAFLGHLAAPLRAWHRSCPRPARAPKKIFSLPRALLGLLRLHAGQQLVGIGAVVGHAGDDRTMSRLRRSTAAGDPSARFSSSTLTRGSPSTPNVRAFGVLLDQLAARRSAGRPRAVATRPT